MPTYEQMGFGQGAALTGDRARAVFGHVMGLVAFALGFAALGAYIARNFQGGDGIIFFLGALACIFGLQFASARGHEQLAVGLLFGMGLLLGMAVAPVLDYYAKTDPGVVYQAAGATALFVGLLGSVGYATRRDLSPILRPLMIAFIPVFLFGLIALFVAIPGSNIIYCVLMLAIFGGFTLFDFNRLARNPQYTSAVPIAASIFLDIFNVFLLLLSLFGGGSNRR
ncbi:MAG TPA: Bax inhibitor-1 family protein [Solirubrobacteraceae bacterium]|nr:Bax inhibitor-1 family protein [Solirubrobacteraceae bacterium]